MARAMASSGGWVRDPVPMVEMNTTPLIDVMLVLLIMFIITVPSPTHQVDVALPTSTPPPPDWVRPLRNDLTMSADGKLGWNEHAITDRQLVGLLGAVADAPRPPEVHFRPDASAWFERVDEVLAIAARSGATTFGFAGNEQYRDSF